MKFPFHRDFLRFKGIGEFVRKLLLLFLMLITEGAIGAPYFNTVTIHKAKAGLDEVLREINKQTGYLYSASEETLNRSKRIDFEIKNAGIEQVLFLFCQGQPLTYSINDNIIIIKDRWPMDFGFLFNPQPVVLSLIDTKGRIINEKGEPVIATVSVKGTKTAVITNANGEFVIKLLDQHAILVVSGVGVLPTEIAVNGRTDLSNIKVASDVALLPVIEINTGYHQYKPNEMIGSVDLVSNKTYNLQTGTRVLDRLGNGGLFGSIPRIISTLAPYNLTIRGASTFTSSRQTPLVVLDNFIYNGDINIINPNDIENITILKDAAATSIYGAQAANGVIVITSKKGRFNQPPQVEFSFMINVAAKPDLFFTKSISSADRIDAETILFNNDINLSDTALPFHLPLSPVYEILLKKKNGMISAPEADRQLNTLRNIDVRNDFMKYFYRTAVIRQYYLAIHAGSRQACWSLSAGLDQDINELYAKYNRATLKLISGYNLTKNLSSDLSLSFIHANSTDGRPAYGSITGITPYSKFADDKGNALPLYNKYRQGYIDTAGGGQLPDWNFYPLNDYRDISSVLNNSILDMMIRMKYRITPSFIASISYSYQQLLSNREYTAGANSYEVRDLVNSFHQPQASDPFPVPQTAIHDLFTSSQVLQQARAQLDYERSWKNFTLTALAGAEISSAGYSDSSRRQYADGAGLNLDFTTLYNLYNGAGDERIPNPSDRNRQHTRMVSLYHTSVLGYRNRYSLLFSFRKDASNNFGVNTNDKWNLLWSTGLGWEISKERFYHLVFLSYLRARFSYGLQGNVDPHRTAVTTLIYSSVPDQLTGASFANIDKPQNPNQRWELTAQRNFGIDFSLRNERISGSIDAYIKNTSNLFAQEPVDPTAGIGRTVNENVGRMIGKGLEFRINTINIDHCFYWKSSINFNFYNDYITHLNKLPDDSSYSLSGGVVLREDHSPFYIYAYKWAGLDPQTGDPRGYLRGVVSKDWRQITTNATSADIRNIGRMVPAINTAIGNMVGWKNFSIYIQFTCNLGYYFRRSSINYSTLMNNGTGHSDYALRWQKPGDEAFTSVPSFVIPVVSSRDNFYALSEDLATRGDNIRMEYINISYEINKKATKKWPFASFRLYAVINNIGIIWRVNKQGLDPDYPDWPPPRTISFGLKANL